jgi:hypothetical protein
MRSALAVGAHRTMGDQPQLHRRQIMFTPPRLVRCARFALYRKSAGRCPGTVLSRRLWQNYVCLRRIVAISPMVIGFFASQPKNHEADESMRPDTRGRQNY